MLNTTMTVAVPDTNGTDTTVSDQQLLRMRRIAKRVFKVEKCILRFDDAQIGFHEGLQSKASVEADFCASLPIASVLLVVPDAKIEPLMSHHPMVVGAPHIRFYAGCPVYNELGTQIGSINLLDYKSRSFSENDKLALRDMARMVERELHVRSASARWLYLEQKTRSLRRKSLIDPLIGIWNRSAIMRILGIEFTRCDKLGVPLSVVVLDLDFFKRINDTYGHPAGDAVLASASNRLRSCMRQLESLGRYGGEEFLVVLPGSSLEVALSIGERMRDAIASVPENIGGELVRLTISAGVCCSELFPTASTDELINRADKALYAAKAAGRNCVMPSIAADVVTKSDDKDSTQA